MMQWTDMNRRACAGLTNAFWMRPGSVLLQLVPYGWEVHHGQLIRSSLSQDIPLAVGGHYLQVALNPAPLTCSSLFEHHAVLSKSVSLEPGAQPLSARPLTASARLSTWRVAAQPCTAHTEHGCSPTAWCPPAQQRTARHSTAASALASLARPEQVAL